MNDQNPTVLPLASTGHPADTIPDHLRSPTAGPCVPTTHHSPLPPSQAGFVQLLADTMTLRDLYAKHADQAAGQHRGLFEQLCHQHQLEHTRLADLLARQVRALGAVAPPTPDQLAAQSKIPRPPRRAESLPVQLLRLFNAHKVISRQATAMLATPWDADVDGSLSHQAALVTTELLLTGKVHVSQLSEHLRRLPACSRALAQTALSIGRIVLPTSPD